MPTVIIVGCGYVGQPTARLFNKAGWKVKGITHSEESARNLSAEPYPVVPCDITDRGNLESRRAEFSESDLIIDCVSSSKGGPKEYLETYFKGAQNLLDIAKSQKFIFTSSTSVYAQADGSWVTEESRADPSTESGKILIQTEELVLARGGIVARLAGIYGPGRTILLKNFLEDSAVIEGEGSRVINQIHRDDAANALLFLGSGDVASGIYNVADDFPTTQLEYYQWLAEQLNKPLPPHGPVNTNRKRGNSSKRVSNQRLKELRWKCIYPSYKDTVLNQK